MVETPGGPVLPKYIFILVIYVKRCMYNNTVRRTLPTGLISRRRVRQMCVSRARVVHITIHTGIQNYCTTCRGCVGGGAVFGYSGHGARENRPTGSKTRRLIRSHLTVQRPFPGVRRPTPGYDFHVLRSHRRGNGRTSTAAPHEPPFTKTHKSHQFECTIFFGLVQVELLSNEN